ncbi:MAG: indolepyruvate oxidoreductase subunit beta, partial [Treponemataceae bacterium]|nr:indolepyruvate oxidoreductase subunit beta [Treponemataceae bacterium]
MAKNILICGVGGQGTVLAAKVLSQAAISKGERVLSAETIGMAQRGGSVVSHVRIGSDVYSPLVPKGQADILIAFEAAEAVRNIDYLKKGGSVIVNRRIVQPVTASLNGKIFDEGEMIAFLEKKSGKVVAVDTDQACKKLGSSKVVNMVLLGAACRSGLISKEEL